MGEAQRLRDSGVRFQRSRNAAKLYADMQEQFDAARGIETRYKDGWQNNIDAPWRDHPPFLAYCTELAPAKTPGISSSRQSMSRGSTGSRSAPIIPGARSAATQL